MFEASGAATKPTARASTRCSDRWAISLILVGFGLIQLPLCSRLPYPWIDEVYFAEPAINLVRGDGFISTAWIYSSESRVFASTSPAYSLLLAGWLRVFGVSAESVRSLGPALAATAAVLLWIAVTRLGWIEGAGAKALAVILSLTSYGFVFSYRGGRPESLTALLAGLLLYLSSGARSRASQAVFFVVAASVPFAGQATVVAFSLLLVWAAIAEPSRWLRGAVIGILAMAFGTLAFRLIYGSLGIWGDFLRAAEAEGGSTLWGRIWNRLTSNPLTHHSSVIPRDLSLFPLMLVMGSDAIQRWRSGPPWWRRPEILCFCYVSAVTGVLYFVGKFPTYYAWMITVPVIVTLVGMWSHERTRPSPVRKMGRRLGIVAAFLLGLPLQVGSALPDWQERDPEPVRLWISEVVRPEDVVMTDYVTYYPVKARARKTYLTGHSEMMSAGARAALTVLILSPHYCFAVPREKLIARLGPGWIATGERYRAGRGSLLGNTWRFGYLSLPNYDVDVFRRSPASHDSQLEFN